MTTNVSWLVTAPRSKKVIVVGPGVQSGVDDAVARIDAELDGMKGPAPAWFRVIEKTGYWWYLICIAVAVVVMLFVGDAPIALRIGTGIGIGIVLAVVSGIVLGGIARAQAGAGSASAAAPGAGIEAGGAARLAWANTPDQVSAVLQRSPELEDHVHVLAWRAARATTPDGQDAAQELAALWKDADPQAASAQEAEIERMKQTIRDLNQRGK